MVRLKTEQNCGKYKRILKVFLLVKGFVFLCVYQYLSYTSTMANSNLINVTKSVLYASPSSVSLASIVQPEEKHVIDVCLKYLVCITHALSYLSFKKTSFKKMF